MRRGRRQPGLRGQRRLSRRAQQAAKAPPRMARFADDAGVVAAAGQHERQRGRRQAVQLVDRTPRRHMVRLGADAEDRQAQVRQSHRSAIHGEAAGGQVVVQVQVAQVLAVHARGHAGGVGVPGLQIGHGAALAQQVFAGHARPHQLACAQQLERAAHLARREIAQRRHFGFHQRNLEGIDEQAQLAGFAEVGLRRQQAQAGQAAVAVARHGAGGHGEQGAAQAVARRMYPGAGHDGLDRRQRLAHAQAQVILQAQIAIGRRGVLP